MDLSALHAINDPVALRDAARALLAQVMAERDDAVVARDDARVERDTARAQVKRQSQLIDARERTITHRDAQIAALTAEVARLRRVQFSAKSERMDPAQRALFEETMAADIAALEAQLEAIQSQDEDAARTRRARSSAGAGPWPGARLPEHLERIETRHEPETCTCPQCQGALVAIGEHVSERLACKPLEFFVKRDVYPQYACRACEQVVAEPVAPAIIGRGQADASTGRRRSTPVQVLRCLEPRWPSGSARWGWRCSRWPIGWANSCGPSRCCTPTSARHPGADPPMVVFEFQTSRSGAHAREFLGDWCGSLMVDEYGGYKALWDLGVTELGCWAHARRKWFDQHKASGSAIAAEALARIGVLYRIEEQARDMTAEERHAHRQQQAVPALAELKQWLDELQPKVLGNSGTARALAYTLRRWEALTRYAGDGRYPIDNNLIENAIRPIALGRKNWLFAGSEQAGRRAAAIMSLVATAKANGLDPHAWLTDTLARLPSTLDRDIDRLLPLRQS